jgi:hypothetical protein
MFDAYITKQILSRVVATWHRPTGLWPSSVEPPRTISSLGMAALSPQGRNIIDGHLIPAEEIFYKGPVLD